MRRPTFQSRRSVMKSKATSVFLHTSEENDLLDFIKSMGPVVAFTHDAVPKGNLAPDSLDAFLQEREPTSLCVTQEKHAADIKLVRVRRTDNGKRAVAY